MINKHMTTTLMQLREQIWAEQQIFFEQLIANEVKCASQDMLNAALEQMLTGGKRIRAFLPVYIYKYYENLQNKKINKKEKGAAKWLGLCCELLHAATLCHDDIMDGDETRRNAPTVWAKYGIPQGINVGDFLIFLSQESIHHANLSLAKEVLAQQAWTRLSRRLVHGQALEFELKRLSKLPIATSYKEIAAGKTGGLFALCLVFGGIAAKVTKSELKKLEKLGLTLGEIFQIQDDINDILGNKGRDIPASDLWEGKPSWLIAQAVLSLSAKEQKTLLKLLYLPRQEKKQSHVDRIYHLIEKSGALTKGLHYLTQMSDIDSPFWKEFKNLKPLIKLILSLLQPQMKKLKSDPLVKLGDDKLESGDDKRRVA